ncbi:MAG: phosphoribosylamine--glycine ligase, partial [Gammaproteobacteria bacterium]
IPTLPFAVCEDAAQVAKWCAARRPPFVIKADSLAAGKGVFVCESEQQAQQAAADILGGKFGGTGVIAEEYCGGAETSFIVITDGKTALPLPSSCDYKRLHDGGKGANTGGMGAVSPSPFFDMTAEESAMRDIIHPTLTALADDGAPFCGFLYAGLVRDEKDKWQVLEFNCRMGDPEAQAILPRLQGDIFPLLLAAAKESAGGLDGLSMPPAAGSSVCLVLAAGGYPQKPVIGDVMTIDEPPDGVYHYYAATKRDDGGKVITNGGRVMSITAVAENNENAVKLAYEGADGVKFRAMHYRQDIGKHTIGEKQ